MDSIRIPDGFLTLEGIDLEQETSSNCELTFVKLSATNEFLFRYAEKFEIKIPFCLSWQQKIKEHEAEVLRSLAIDERLRQKMLKLNLQRNIPRLRNDSVPHGGELAVTNLKNWPKSRSTSTIDQNELNTADITSDIDWFGPENNFLSDVGEYTATGIRIYRGIIERTITDFVRKFVINHISIKDDSFPAEKEWLHSAEYRRSGNRPGLLYTVRCSIFRTRLFRRRRSGGRRTNFGSK